MITKLHYNWLQGGEGNDMGEEYFVHEVGKKGVTEIIEHIPQGEGDRWLYDVVFGDNKPKTKVRIFNPNQVFYESNIG